MRRETNARQCQSRSRQTDRMPIARRRARTPVLVLLAALALCGCEATTLKHGTQFHDGDLQQIQPGMSQEQVRMNLGTPATTAVVNNGQAFYYISSTQTQSAFFLPSEKDRQVVAVYFSPGGTVDRVANYGMQDGKVFDYVSRTTPTSGQELSYLTYLFKIVGK